MSNTFLVIIIFLMIFTILYAWIALTQIVLRSRCTQLKKRVNKLYICIERVNFSHLEIIGKKQANIAELLHTIKEHHHCVEQNLEIIRTKILGLTSLNNKMLISHSAKLYRSINSELTYLEDMQERIVNSIANTNDFYNDVSNILIGLCDAENELERFYAKSLYNEKYKSNEYADKIEKAKSICKELLNERNDVNYTEFIKKSIKCADILSSLYTLISESFVPAIAYEYLNSKFKIIEDMNLEKEINNKAELKIIREVKLIGKGALTHLIEAINNFNNIEIKKNIIKASNSINNVLQRINIFKKSSSKILHTQFDIVHKMLSEIQKYCNELERDVYQIQQDFKGSSESLKADITNITTLTTKMVKNIKDATSTTYQANLSQTEYIILYKSTITNLLTWKEKISKLLITINNKIDEFVELINGFAKAKILVIYLKKSKARSNAKDTLAINNFNVLIKTINENLKLLTNDYEKNCAQCQRDLKVINNELDCFVDKLYIDEELRAYAQNLTFYANQFRDSEGTEKAFEEIDDFNTDHNYHESINSLLKLLTTL